MVQSCPTWLSTPETPAPLLSTIPPNKHAGLQYWQLSWELLAFSNMQVF